MVEYPFLDQKGGQPWTTDGTYRKAFYQLSSNSTCNHFWNQMHYQSLNIPKYIRELYFHLNISDVLLGFLPHVPKGYFNLNSLLLFTLINMATIVLSAPCMLLSWEGATYCGSNCKRM